MGVGSQLLAGSHVFVYVNGKPFGRISQLDINIETPRKNLAVIDSLENAEFIQTGITINCEMTIFKVHADGGVEAAGMVACQQDLVREKYFSILVIDRVTDTVIFEARKCSVSRQNWVLGRNLVIGRIGFSAISSSNETEPSPA